MSMASKALVFFTVLFAAAAETQIVVIGDDQTQTFSPNTLQAPVGSTVRFVFETQVRSPS